MRSIPALLAGAVISTAMLATPAHAAPAPDTDPNPCGADFTVVQKVKLEGPKGSERLGHIVQTSNAETHDGCAYLVLKKQKGTKGDVNIYTSDETDVYTDEHYAVDLTNGDYVSVPTFYDSAVTNYANFEAYFDGVAFQGKTKTVKETVKVTKAAKDKAKKVRDKALKAANKKHGKANKAAQDKANKAYKDACKGKTVTKKVEVATAFSTDATLGFNLDGTATDDDSTGDDDGVGDDNGAGDDDGAGDDNGAGDDDSTGDDDNFNTNRIDWD